MSKRELTEGEWLSSKARISNLLRIVRTCHITDRQLRLFGCACCRRIADLLDDERYNCMIALAEEYEDGLRTADELQFARDSLVDVLETIRNDVAFHYANSALFSTLSSNLGFRAIEDIAAYCRIARVHLPNDKTNEEQVHIHYYRDLIGNPFRPVTFIPSWRTGNVLELAQMIYNNRTYNHMPILADALMDAGCEDEQIIGHCHSDGPHVHGCWLLDMILGKS
jgi:hypothetical protein